MIHEKYYELLKEQEELIARKNENATQFGQALQAMPKFMGAILLCGMSGVLWMFNMQKK